MDWYTFQARCCVRGVDNWEYKYSLNRLLPLKGTLTDDLMRNPDMLDRNGEPCLPVVKNGKTGNAIIGRANGIFSIVREYFGDMSVNQTSMEWAIINYGCGSDEFSEPGDSGAVIADIRGRIGGMVTSGSGKSDFLDITYATPFWWILERIRANGFPHAHLDVIT